MPARAAAVFDLVATRTSTRPTDAPGAMAWLRRVIDGAGDRTEAGLGQPSDAIPAELEPMIAAMKGEGMAGVPVAPAFEGRGLDLPQSPRRQRIVRAGDRFLALTRRRSVDLEPLRRGSVSNDFVLQTAPMLIEMDSRLRAWLDHHTVAGGIGGRPARPVRLYAVHEDATLLSLPWSGEDRDSSRAAAELEVALLSERPNLPTFAPEEFFFRSTRDAYSGFYLDLGGRGLVSTVTMPVAAPDGGRAVVALDIAFDVDWPAVARSLDPPISGAAVELAPTAPATWAALGAALGVAGDNGLRRALTGAVSLEQRSRGDEPPSPLRHAVVAGGAVAAFHVSDRTWLLAWFPQTPQVFPLAAVALLSVMLALLLTGFEVNRRRADAERRVAEGALQEKQNLLNTMQVPLVVVDPNSDEIVSANQAADAIGFRAGRRFADLVWPDARARAYYEHMQVASPEPRRAYGVPVAVTSGGVTEERYAIVRSVAVTAPIEALKADERHRLGVLILVDPDTDLTLYVEDLAAAAHRDERRRLAGLLTHGVDTLARVLEHSLTHTPDPFAAWLAEYLERRVSVTAWLLDHWDALPPLPRDSVIDSVQARATLDRLVTVLEVIARDRDFRSRLHWDNGTLSSPQVQVLEVACDWPPDVDVTCPVRGGFGLFLNELIANAVRHGVPGTTPRLSIVCDRVRGELLCRIENAVAEGAAGPERADAYGGLAMVRAMARLFEWRDLEFRREGGVFQVVWAVPFSTRRPGEAD
jgi:hypothetical protein